MKTANRFLDILSTCCLIIILTLCFSTAASAGLRSRLSDKSTACKKSAEVLLKAGYSYASVFSLLSADQRELALFVKFYRLKKMRGRVFQQIDINHKLLRYELSGQAPRLISEQRSCEKNFDLEHHRGLIDGNGTVFLYSRRRKGFSLWPKDPKSPIRFEAVTGATSTSVQFAWQPGSGLIYAIAEKRIHRNSKAQPYRFQEWLRFDDFVTAGEKWNPLNINANKDSVSVILYLWRPKAGFRGGKSLLSFNNRGGLLKKHKIDGKHLNQFRAGPPPVGALLKMSKDKKTRDTILILSAAALQSGAKREIIRLSIGFGLKHRTVMLSNNGNVFAVYDYRADKGENETVLYLVQYDKQKDKVTRHKLPLYFPATSGN